MRYLIIVALLAVSSAKAETYVCNMEKSSADFKHHKIFEVKKIGKNVRLTGIEATGEMSDDYWSYTVLAENKQIGFRAYRSISSKGDEVFDIAIGGELQLVRHEGINLSITYSNAPAGTGGMVALECKEM